MYRDRDEAGWRLAQLFVARPLNDPLVLAIPRGGVAAASALARSLDAELDVVLAHKVGMPNNPEFALGAVDEDGFLTLNSEFSGVPPRLESWIRSESARQAAILRRRRVLYRGDRKPWSAAGRSVLVVDDGVATGATLVAALQTLQTAGATEAIAAVPVGAVDRLDELRRCCDDVVCPMPVQELGAVGSYYLDFRPVEDDVVVRLLNEAWNRRSDFAASRGESLASRPQ